MVNVCWTGVDYRPNYYRNFKVKEEEEERQKNECLEILPECKKILEENREELGIFFEDERRKLDSLERALLDGRISVAYNPLRYFVSILKERVETIKKLKNFALEVMRAKKEIPKERPTPPKEISVEKPHRVIYGEMKEMPDGTKCQEVWHFHNKDKFVSTYIYKYGRHNIVIPESEDGMRKEWHTTVEGWYLAKEENKRPVPEKIVEEWEKKFSEYMAEKERYEREKAIYLEKLKEWESDIVNISHYYVHLYKDEQHRGIVVKNGFPYVWDIEEGGEWTLIPLTYIPKTVRG